MLLKDWTYCGSHEFYDKKLLLLAVNELAAEKWSFDANTDFCILRNYIFHSFEKLWDERENIEGDMKQEYVYFDDKQACFNTGLFDKTWQPVLFYCVKNRLEGYQPWQFKSFHNSYTIKYTDMPTTAVTKLRRPNYFNNPSALIFDVRLPIIPQWDHILYDVENYMRIPEQLRNMGKEFCQNLITGAIESVKKRIEANFKTIVPQWYKGKIQLLAPLYLTNPERPDLALVLSLSEDKLQYYGHTCLTMEMAYNNARLIARPDSYWLQA